jgi:hypothetical protein
MALRGFFDACSPPSYDGVATFHRTLVKHPEPGFMAGKLRSPEECRARPNPLLPHASKRTRPSAQI